MVEFYLLTFPRFPLRKKEHKSYFFGKNRTHDFRTSRCAAYLLHHSGVLALKFWHDRAASDWPHEPLLARLFAGVNRTSSQAERELSALCATRDNLQRTMTTDKKVGQTMPLCLNQSLILAIKAPEKGP